MVSGCFPGQQGDKSLNPSPNLLCHSHQPVCNVSFCWCQESVPRGVESHIMLNSKALTKRPGKGQTFILCQEVRELSVVNVPTSMAGQLSSIWEKKVKANMKIHQ